MTDDERMVEALAAWAHDEQWTGWMKYLFSKCATNADGTKTIPAWAVERWTRQVNTSYTFLPDAEKESDRAEARGLLRVIEAFAEKVVRADV